MMIQLKKEIRLNIPQCYNNSTATAEGNSQLVNFPVTTSMVYGYKPCMCNPSATPAFETKSMIFCAY
jgi:hypothetical protein